VEGPDGGGKSTLCRAIGEALQMRVQQGSGPPKRPGEIERRTREYLSMRGTVFDRHPAVSQPVYGQIRGEVMSPQLASLVLETHSGGHLFVYCRTVDGLSRHVVKSGEDPAHVKKLTENYEQIVEAYDRWALRHAKLIYRIGDDVEELIDIVRVIAC